MSDDNNNNNLNHRLNLRYFETMQFTRYLMNLIVPGNPVTMATEEDTEFVRRVFVGDMQTAIRNLHCIYRVHARELFSELVARDRVNMLFFDEFAPTLRDRLFRTGISYDKFLHFSVLLVCLAELYNRRGLPYALYSTNDVIQSVLTGVLTFDVEALHRIAREYTHSYIHREARELEILELLFPEPVASNDPVINEPYGIPNRPRFRRRFTYCACDTSLRTKDEKMKLMRSEENEAALVVQNPQVLLNPESVLPVPELEGRRRRQSVENNPEDRSPRITHPSIDYIALPGSSRDSNPGVVFCDTDTAEDQLIPRTRTISKRRDKNDLSGSSKRAKLNNISPNNEVMQDKSSGNKKNNPTSIESSSDTE